MRIQHNISALNAHRQLGSNQTAIGKNLEKLSSGYRINRAGDDAAGLAISEKMRSQIKGLETAQKNANDGISLVQTAEGALTEVHSMLNRMTELATQSANGTYDDKTDRANLQKELNSLRSEVDRIAEATDFNGIKLLNGNIGGKNVFSASGGTGMTSLTIKGGNLDTAGTGTISFNTSGATTQSGSKLTTAVSGVTFKQVSTTGDKNKGTIIFEAVVDTSSLTDANKALAEKYKGVTVTVGHNAITTDGSGVSKTMASGIGKDLDLQVGDTNDTHQKVSVTIGNMNSKSLGIDTISIGEQGAAGEAIKAIKDAINTVSSTRGDLGAIQNRLEHTINNLGVTAENMTAAESRIRDVDMAKEMMEFTKNNILSQAATSMLAQANQSPQGVLQLLQ